MVFRLLQNLGHASGSNRTAAFADSETLGLFHSDRGNEFHFDGDFVARHNHFDTFRQLDDAGNVGRSEVELRTIVAEERAVTSAFLFGEDVDFSGEGGVRGDGARLCENLSALDLVFSGTTEEAADIIASLTFIEFLVEHFNAGDCGLVGRFDTNDFDNIANLDFSALDTAGNNGTTTFDGEDVFDRHHSDRSPGERDKQHP